MYLCGGRAGPRRFVWISNSSDEDLRQKYYRILGVDLTAVPSLNVGTVKTSIAEVGPDFSRFRYAGAFASWLILCPNNTITGGEVEPDTRGE